MSEIDNIVALRERVPRVFSASMEASGAIFSRTEWGVEIEMRDGSVWWHAYGGGSPVQIKAPHCKEGHCVLY
jgi:hypothetical protein